MASFLYACQDQDGREIVSAHVDVEKVSDVQAEVENGTVYLHFEGIVIDSAPLHGEESVTLYRWPSDDKLAKPVSHPVPLG